MTKEEKLEEAKRLYKTANADQRYVLESLFPELAESEDEKIRKEIIRVLKGEISFTSEKENEKYIAWLEKQAQSTTITIPKDLKGTDTDGGVVGEQGEQPTEEEMVGMGELGKVWSEQAIISRLDKIIELLQSAILPIPRSPYVPTTIYKNPLDPDPNTLGGWETTASTEGGGE